jgi:Tfp pilus assembly protein PilF
MSLRTIELEAENASYYDTYGWILFMQKKYTEAKVQIEKSIELSPKNAEVLDHYGDVLFFLGDIKFYDDGIQICNDCDSTCNLCVGSTKSDCKSC